MTDNNLYISVDDAVSLLIDGAYTVHNFAQVGPLLMGCDYDRNDAIAAFRAAKKIAIGGNQCKSIKHPLAVFDQDDNVTFFEADMDKVDAFEEALPEDVKDTE